MGKLYDKTGAHVSTIATDHLDEITDALTCIEYEHHEIHEGESYEYSEVRDQTIDHVWDIQITTPNTTKWAHFTFEFDSEKETDWYFYENPVIVLAGTAVTPLNHNRNSTNTTGLVIKTITNTTTGNANADTTVAAATLLMHGISGDGKKAGGQGGSRHEWILDQNQDYVLRFIATAAGYVNYHLDWYEHTSK